MRMFVARLHRANPPTAILLAEGDDMGMNELNRPSGYSDDSDEPPDSFADRVRDVFPKGATARLARAMDVNTRLAQRWMSGQNEPPPEALAFISEQTRLLAGTHIAERLRSFVEELQGKGIDHEVIGSQIAAAYEELMGRELD